MERHRSIGSSTIAALMAAHRLAQDQPPGSHRLDDFFKQEAARIAGCQRGPDESGEAGNDPVKRSKITS